MVMVLEQYRIVQSTVLGEPKQTVVNYLHTPAE